MTWNIQTVNCIPALCGVAYECQLYAGNHVIRLCDSSYNLDQVAVIYKYVITGLVSMRNYIDVHDVKHLICKKWH